MDLSENDKRLIAALENGLPLTSRPYLELGRRAGLEEDAVISRISRLLKMGLIKRLGVIVRHRELGYRANAMVVWDVPDEDVEAVGRCFSRFDFVTLCYRRPRRLPDWPYNLFCMVHGRERQAVLAQVGELAEACAVEGVPHDVLFSARRFKQRGAVYSSARTSLEGAA